MKKLIFLMAVLGLSCGGDSTTGPETTEQEVRFAFVMKKAEWYDCAIAVQGNHDRTIHLYLGGGRVGALTQSNPVADQRFETFVRPGRYTWSARGTNYKNETLAWGPTETLANYPMGATVYLVCN